MRTEPWLWHSRIILMTAISGGTTLGTGCAAVQPGNGPERPGPPEGRKVETMPVPVDERVIDLGRSVEGRPLTLYLFGGRGRVAAVAPGLARSGERADDLPPAGSVLILAAIHGNEPSTADLGDRLLAYLRGHPGLYRDRPVALLPAANPDGLAARTRGNARRVDLNRNFAAGNWRHAPRAHPSAGAQPLSEPETRAMAAALDLCGAARVLSVHSMAAPCNNYDGPAQGLARAMAGRNGYPVKASIGYPTPGSLGSWAGIDRHIPTLTLELPLAAGAPENWEKNRDAIAGFIRGEEQ